MGLSKLGPANQPHSFLATNVVGTIGYIDPLYVDTYSLTKESDIYSFGVVLFEVLCGRLCFIYNNDHLQILVQLWKQAYTEKKLDEIIFQDMKQHMDRRSLETFSDIAYQCLSNTREERPLMSHVVEKLEIALRFQEMFEEVEPPTDYAELSKTAVPPLVYESKEELKMLLSKGILLNEGKTWFSLNKNGEHCELISAAECVIPIRSSSIKFAYYGRNRSRFAVDYNKGVNFCYEFKTHVRTQFLSPHTTYAVNLVFDHDYNSMDYLSVNYRLAAETKSSTLYFVDQREDGWFMAELYQFTSDRKNFDLEIVFHCWKPLLLEGIEFQPVESTVAQQVEHQVLDDEEVNMQTTSHPDTYWDQKLPSDYEDIIMLSKCKVQWTTKKELYSIFCKGFPVIYNSSGEEWFSLAKNGKKCHMLPARVVLRNEEWKWWPLPKSRFEEVAFDPHSSFWIYCRSNMLSPQTRYASYLVYQLQGYNTGFEAPIKVSFSVDPNCSWYVYLLNPKTPIIGKVNENTHNPLNRPKMKGLSQQRNDGWMEVQLLEFQTGTTIEWISQYLQLTSFCNSCLKGLIVQGIEFKPILEIHTLNSS